MRVNPDLYNPDPTYLRSLLDKAGISQHLAARILRIKPDNFRHWLDGRRFAPYTVQVCLEWLAENPPQKEDFSWGQSDG